MSVRKHRLGDVATIIDSLHKTPKYSEDGEYPMVRVQDVNGSFLNLEGCKKVRRSVYLEFCKRYKPKKGDIVFSRVGSYGKMCYVNNNDKFCLGQNTITISPSIDNLFLYYSLRSPYVKNQIESMVGGASQPTISLKNIGNIDISVPEHGIQLKISNILYSYDRLIENNKGRIKSLEESATRLYQEWFVKFQFPGHENVLMVDSELGPIPEGWYTVKLTDSFNFCSGKSIKPGRSGKYPVYGSNGLIGRNSEYLHENAIILGRVGAYCGSVSFCKGKFWASDNTIVAKPIPDELNIIFAFYLLKKMNLNHLAGGAAQPLITQTILKNLSISIPPDGILDKFHIWAHNFWSESESLRLKNQQLRAARDLLLPKLISGQLDVSELDIATEEMVTA